MTKATGKIVEARQVHFTNRTRIAGWCGGVYKDWPPGEYSIKVPGSGYAMEGDWIVLEGPKFRTYQDFSFQILFEKEEDSD